MPDETIPAVTSDADAPGPMGSCLICGHMRTLVVWREDTVIGASPAGACAECRDRVAGWDALEDENDKLRRRIAGLVERVNRQRDRINRAHAALDGEKCDV